MYSVLYVFVHVCVFVSHTPQCHICFIDNNLVTRIDTIVELVCFVSLNTGMISDNDGNISVIMVITQESCKA